MPPTLRADNQRAQSVHLSVERDESYTYPNKLKLKPDTDLHRKLVDMVIQRAQRSYDTISKRFDTWDAISRDMTVYIEKDDYEQAVNQKDSRKPVSLVVPTSWAAMETLVTFNMGTFLGTSPYFRYRGQGPEDTVGAILLEMAVAWQSVKFNHAEALITQWKDCFKCGYGVITPEWSIHRGRKTRYIDPYAGTQLEGLFGRRVNEDAVLKEGHKLCNISPYRYFPDPAVPVHKPDDGEFVGWIERTNIMNLIAAEEEGDYFNVKYLKRFVGDSNGISYIYKSPESADRHGPEPQPYADTESHPVDVIHMYVKLIPKQWELGKKEMPEIWRFSVAADNIVIQAKPIDLNHNTFPVAIAAPDTDGYAGMPLAKMEIINPLQHTLNFLWNSHVVAIKKNINNQYVVDPQIINMATMRHPEEGGIILLRKSAWGQGRVTDGIHQFPVNDVTRSNIADMAVLKDVISQTVAPEQLTGNVVTSGERISADMSRGSRLAGLSRFESTAMMIAFQSMHRLGDMLASQTQQFMSEEIYQHATGNWFQALHEEYGDTFNRSVAISPADIMVDYDIMPADSVTNANNEFTQEFVQLFQIAMQDSEIRQKKDIARMFDAWARRAGFKNTHEFDRTKSGLQGVIGGVGSPQQLQGNPNLMPLGGPQIAS